VGTEILGLLKTYSVVRPLFEKLRQIVPNHACRPPHALARDVAVHRDAPVAWAHARGGNARAAFRELLGERAVFHGKRPVVVSWKHHRPPLFFSRFGSWREPRWTRGPGWVR
jgi:hypothetical protein